MVAEQQLQRMTAGRQLDDGLRLATAEMPVLTVRWDRQARGRQPGIDEQVVMTGPLHIDTRRGNAHAAQSELHQHRTGDLGAITWLYEINRGAVIAPCRAMKRGAQNCDKERAH